MQDTAHGTTAHITVDTRFAGFLSDDFGISVPKILKALEGEPQRAAIGICEWASETDEPGKALINYAKKYRTGAFRKARRNMTAVEQRAELDRRAS